MVFDNSYMPINIKWQLISFIRVKHQQRKVLFEYGAISDKSWEPCFSKLPLFDILKKTTTNLAAPDLCITDAIDVAMNATFYEA
jgi:hypothetical protein